MRALTGEDGLRLARAQMPDLITLDWRLPGRRGLEVAQTLSQGLKLLPWHFFVSRVASRKELADALRLPEIAGYLIKPVAAETLLQRVSQVLSHRREQASPAWDGIGRCVRAAAQWQGPERRAHA